MRRLNWILPSLFLFFAHGLVRADTVPAQAEEKAAPVRMRIAALAFTGEDKELGRFLTETVMTDLGQSDLLQTYEATEVLRAMEDQGLSKSPPLSAEEVRKLGGALGADRLLIGSYMERDGQMTINARLLDFKEGSPVPGAAINVSGERRDLLGIIHKLTRQFHRRLTGRDLSLIGAPADVFASPALASSSSAQSVLSLQRAAPVVPDDVLTPLRAAGIVPTRARPNGPVSESELGGLVGHLAKLLGSNAVNAVTLMQPNSPVTRLRALAALVKLVAPAERLADLQNTEIHFPSDSVSIASWGRPYVAAAIDQGWVSSGENLRPRDGATWTFIAALVQKMGVLEAPTHQEALASLPGDAGNSIEVESFTGLVVDARDLRIQRAMGPRVLDEDGHIVYPDPKHIPDIDYLQDHGMADYDSSIETASRAGKHPLVVKALSAPEPGRDDIVISNEDAERVRAANRRNHFMSHWAICILTGAN